MPARPVVFVCFEIVLAACRWQYCAAAMLMGLPLSIHRKSYWPVALAAVGGTAADFMEVSKCTRACTCSY